MTDGTRWMEEVAANVSRRVKKWQDWEKSPALKASEELIGGRGMMTAEQFKYRIEIPTETKFMRLPDGEEISTEATECEIEFAAQLADKEREKSEMVDSLGHTRSCPALTPGNEEYCTCGLRWRILLRTEQEMHAAWRKRAEAAEQRLQVAQADLKADDLDMSVIACEASSCDATRESIVKRVRELRQREAELEQRWIKVGERLPEDCGQFLVFGVGVDDDGYATGGVQEAGYDLADGWLPHNWKDHEVTHWQPLPSPPKEGAL